MATQVIFKKKKILKEETLTLKNLIYAECGPCASLVMCAVCETPYGDGELIMHCNQCRRWLHAACDSVHSEKDADFCCQKGYL